MSTVQVGTVAVPVELRSNGFYTAEIVVGGVVVKLRRGQSLVVDVPLLADSSQIQEQGRERDDRPDE